MALSIKILLHRSLALALANALKAYVAFGLFVSVSFPILHFLTSNVLAISLGREMR
jgi:hypothetical protein